LTTQVRSDDNSSMDDKPTKRGGGAAVVLVLIAVLIVLPMLYVLSTGPMVWMVHNGLISTSLVPILSVIYAPLEWVAHNVPVIGPAIENYVSWWRPANSALAPPSGS
jgi:hypothetical protein